MCYVRRKLIGLGRFFGIAELDVMLLALAVRLLESVYIIGGLVRYLVR